MSEVLAEYIFDEMVDDRAHRAGWPDRAFLHGNTLIGIEIKQGMSPLSGRQKAIAKLFWAAGWPYLLARYMRHGRHQWSFSVAQYDNTLKRKFRGLTLNQFVQLLDIEGLDQSAFDPVDLSDYAKSVVYGPVYLIPNKTYRYVSEG